LIQRYFDGGGRSLELSRIYALALTGVAQFLNTTDAGLDRLLMTVNWDAGATGRQVKHAYSS
jgi:hypothetical protein